MIADRIPQVLGFKDGEIFIDISGKVCPIKVHLDQAGAEVLSIAIFSTSFPLRLFRVKIVI
jgi:hypothetical protein